MKTKKVIATVISVLLLLCLVGCVSSTNVTFYTDVDGAEVFVDGVSIGTTPTSTVLSNAVWIDPVITIKKDGYKDMVTTLNKEIKMTNLVVGLVVFWPDLLYAWGPTQTQAYTIAPGYQKSEDAAK
ncbi:MAG: PEGA domain-containing protein [Treponema sp.]|nr:PEGA domain-containing protein [Treponema sp.]